ncbi:MAG: ribose 5-phosphate isomerase B [Candidatus Krumholzibacteria bacterium]|nr:ribose 5-phosphate isomerase B [Candidatus Krumholzibacteria bacterium]
MRIAVGSDHRGFALKAHLVSTLAKAGHEIVDLGCPGVEPADYPDFAFAVGEMVASGGAERGILVCGSGIGMSIAANKVRGVRAALCRTVEDARMTRRHNDSNVLALSERGLDDPHVDELVAAWLSTPFEGGRHERRIEKIREYEERC